MKEIDVTELYREFDRRCFGLAQTRCYTNMTEFAHDVFNNYSYIVSLMYGDDENTQKRRIFEYLDGYYYRDPATETQRTFVQWSRFFNEEHNRHSLIELYDECKWLRKELNASNESIKKLKSGISIHARLIEKYRGNKFIKALYKADEAVTKGGFSAIRLGNTDKRDWLNYMYENFSAGFEMIELTKDEIIEYLKEVWNYNTSIYKDEEKLLKDWGKYFEEHTEEIVDEIKENEEEENHHALKEEMKEEAVRRMKSVIMYKDIIDDFIENDTPQVYEPPYGASYALEDDEMEKVREIEGKRNILVWGVIRCFMTLNNEETTIDCMLHVSANKEEWEQERADLKSGIPFVYTSAKEYLLEDSGQISIYQSEGGTLLRN